MTSAIKEIDMEFEEIKNVNIETIGSLSQITRPCPIKYKSMNVQHQQVLLDRRQTLTEFITEGEINLKHGEQNELTDLAVTSDNKLLLCYDEPSRRKVYIYKDYKTYEDEISFTSKPYCITVVPCTDKAVVTLPYEKSIQFINTTNNRKYKKIKIRELCYSVTAVKDKIYIGGENKVLILNTDGSRVRKITTNGGVNYNLLHNERNDQLLLRQSERLCCINLDGHVIYRYNISGYLGLAVDQQGHVYITGRDSNDIHRLSPDGTFRDIVLSKHDGVDTPVGITFNNDFIKLFIINGGLFGGKTVLVYSCK
jgi:DNA-binding beta-propeller fold protein YncE